MEEPIKILYAIIIGIIIVVLGVAVVKIKASEASQNFESLLLDSLTYSKCSAYCLSCYGGDCVCKVNGQSYDCGMFREIKSFTDNLNKIEQINSPFPSSLTTINQEKCKISSITYLSEKQKKDIEKNVERSLQKYELLVDKHASSLPSCLIHAIIAAESSGGIKKVTKKGGKYYSCGITMIAPQTYRYLTHSKCSDKECCDRLANDDELAIRLAVTYLINGMMKVENVIKKQHYPEDDVLKLAYLIAYYNGGNGALEPSKDCSFSKCSVLAESLKRSFGDVLAIPVFLCAYNPGGYVETQGYVRKVLYAYAYCNNLKNNEEAEEGN